MTQFNVDNTRSEIKFVTAEHHYHHVLGWLLSTPLFFKTAYPNRWVNNVYFDTFDLAACAENLSGISDRTKIRYRWYGPDIHPSEGTLEFKRKRNSMGWKHHFKVPQTLYFSGAKWSDMIKTIEQYLPLDALKKLQTNHLPIIINRYLREYFVSADQKVRATIDTKQNVWDQRYSNQPNFSRPTMNLPKTLVVELKFAHTERDTIASIINTCPLRLSRNSKYINAIRSIYPY